MRSGDPDGRVDGVDPLTHPAPRRSQRGHVGVVYPQTYPHRMVGIGLETPLVTPISYSAAPLEAVPDKVRCLTTWRLPSGTTILTAVARRD